MTAPDPRDGQPTADTSQAFTPAALTDARNVADAVQDFADANLWRGLPMGVHYAPDLIRRLAAEVDRLTRERNLLWDATGIGYDQTADFVAGGIRHAIDEARIARTQLRPQLARAQADVERARRELADLKLAMEGASAQPYLTLTRERDEALRWLGTIHSALDPDGEAGKPGDWSVTAQMVRDAITDEADLNRVGRERDEARRERDREAEMRTMLARNLRRICGRLALDEDTPPASIVDGVETAVRQRDEAQEQNATLLRDDLAIRLLLRTRGGSVGGVDPLPSAVADMLDAQAAGIKRLTEDVERHDLFMEDLGQRMPDELDGDEGMEMLVLRWLDGLLAEDKRLRAGIEAHADELHVLLAGTERPREPIAAAMWSAVTDWHAEMRALLGEPTTRAEAGSDG